MQMNSAHNYKNYLPKFFCLVVALFIMLLMNHALQAGLANMHFVRVQSWLQQWSNDASSATPDKVVQAKQAMTKVLALQPDHPHYLLSSAKVMEWAWFIKLVDRAEMQHVDQWYQQAIERRPYWPNAYADYAWYLANVNARLDLALPQLAIALQYGPYIAEVQLRYLAVGLSQWAVLPVEEKKQIYQLLQKNLAAQPRLYSKVRQLVQQFKFEKLGCIYLRRHITSTDTLAYRRMQSDFCAAGG